MSFFQHLGERAAPAFLKLRWLYRSLTGDSRERVKAELGMGRCLAHAFLQDVERDPEPANAERLKALGRRLSPWLTNRDRTFSFYSIATAEVNAFALPGGFIFVSRPLLSLCGGDEPALAFVLAHEMAHVVKEHAFNRMLASEALSLLSQKALSGPTFQQALRSLLTQLLKQGYSRRNEFEADRFGVRLIRAAGFDPAGSVRLLEALGRHVSEPGGAGAYFASHPPFSERIVMARQAMG